VKRSTDRILTTHAGSLPRPPDLWAMVTAKTSGQPVDEAAFEARARSAVAEVVQQQATSGLDVVNDGELSKLNFLQYARERLAGCEPRPSAADTQATASISGRDRQAFPEYVAEVLTRQQVWATSGEKQVYCTGPLRYVGQAAVQADVDRLKAALKDVQAEEAFLPGVAPGTIEHWLGNLHYPSYEELLYGIADAMHEEYKAIVDAGFVLQIDDPGLADSWQMHPELNVAEYRRRGEQYVAAVNHALRDLPPDRVRYHMCWGSYHGPHTGDIPLRDIVDVILKVQAEGISIEASNPRHEHEWRVWEDVKLPDGKILIPGVVGHSSDFVEHPELVAARLVRYARLVGRENVMAGTDCGLGGRVGHPSLVWAKFQAMAEGARLATKQLWA
jgi:5-methyltetrahydropteroyltriglutamate--homocysteine methyltransferase